ncbi:MAG: flagellar hook-basal body protein [Bacillus sp. (in: Bacteria)]|nr:flagellar hook-basal body protein [Bacillus sp. (in: firmicutes)]
MFRGLYTATSGMLAHNRMQQILTNNLANINTPGFKQDKTAMRAFPAQLIKAMGTTPLHTGGQSMGTTNTPSVVGTINTGVYLQEGIPTFTQGMLKETGIMTDMALVDEHLPQNPATQQKGTLVFAVETENNEIRYTRNGSFTVNEAGYLTTGEGYSVLDENLRPIQVNSRELTVNGTGQLLYTSTDGTETTSQLWIGYTENPLQFVKEGHNLLRWEESPEGTLQFIGNVADGDIEGIVRQGFIEQSNVDITETMTQMLSTFRSFESNQRIIQAYDRSMEKTVNELGRV